ncbi:MAG: CehA/McbA family metallohydrolase [Candidatus Eisenbacteria bacterium]
MPPPTAPLLVRVFPALAAAVIAFHPAGGACAAEWALTLEITEVPGAVPAAARVSVTGADALSYRPFPDSLCLYHEALGGFFYAESSAVVLVPEGMTRITAVKGPEFLPVDLHVSVTADTTVLLELERWIEPRDLGWVGGDAHGDLTHAPAAYHIEPDEAKRVAEAEGLRVANFLDNGYLFTGGVGSLSDGSVALYSSEEYRSPVFGHLGLLGIDTLIVPDYGGVGWPLWGDVVDRVREHTHALAVLTHPMTTNDFDDLAGWPGTGLGRGIWIEAPRGRAEAMDILSYSNHGAEADAAYSLWYDLWNSGFPVPGSAGTDAAVCRVSTRPIGGYRVYVLVDDPYGDPAAVHDAWVEGIRRGRTFITAGPLVTAFDVEGAGIGETLAVADGGPRDVTVHARFESARRLDTIEIVRNGEVVESFDVHGGTVGDVTAVVPVRESCWIAARHDGYDYAPWLSSSHPLAHTNPVLVLLGDDPLTSGGAGDRAVASLDRLDSLLSVDGSWPSAADSAAVAQAIKDARAEWVIRGNSPPAPFRLLSPCRGCRLTEARPEFRWEEAADPDTGAPATYRFQLAGDGDFRDVLLDTAGLGAPAFVVPFDLDVDSTYWWRVRALDGSGDVRWSEEIDWWIRRVTPTSVDASAGAGDRLRITASPNPFRGAVRLCLSLPAPSPGTVTIHDVAGRRVRSVPVPSGSREVAWDGRDGRGRALAGGLYLYRLESGGRAETGRLFLIR